jgi:hypothetical protein
MLNATLIRLTLAALLTCGIQASALAGQWDIVLNGKAIHLDSQKDWNESNWGLGFEHEFNPEGRWVKMALGSAFVDSDDEMSYMAGGGIKRRFRLPWQTGRYHVDLGAIGFVMTRQDVNNNRPFPGILPAFSFGSRSFAVNMTYLPGQYAQDIARARTADPTLDGILFVQLKLDARLFGLGGGRSRNRFASNSID